MSPEPALLVPGVQTPLVVSRGPEEAAGASWGAPLLPSSANCPGCFIAAGSVCCCNVAKV